MNTVVPVPAEAVGPPGGGQTAAVSAPSRSLTPTGLRPASAGTARTRAAAARSRRRSAAVVTPGSAVKDPCPQCGTELGQAHGATRRVAVFSSQRGLFLWRCPDCGHGWSEVASSQCGSTTRSPDRLAAPVALPAD